MGLTVSFRLEHDGERWWWVAQCQEHDIAVQALSLPAVAEELQRVIDARIEIAGKLGVEPFADLPPAPEPR